MTLPAHEWREQAACKPTPDRDLTHVFFPTVDETAGRFYAWDPARMICAGCPVFRDCLAFVRANPQPDGVWAGQTPEERRRDAHRRRRGRVEVLV